MNNDSREISVKGDNIPFDHPAPGSLIPGPVMVCKVRPYKNHHQEYDDNPGRIIDGEKAFKCQSRHEIKMIWPDKYNEKPCKDLARILNI
jgi:hypothetical protein